MNIYRLILLLLIFLFLIEDKLKMNKRLYGNIKKITIFILILLVGYRGNLALDDQGYIDLFSSFEYSFEFFNNSRYEVLFLILNGIIKIFTSNFNLLFFIIAAISLYNLYKFINFFSVSFFYSIAFYYCRWLFLKEFTQIRNALACSIFYLALIELYKKNNLKYYILVLIGGLIHKSIFFCLTFPLFLKIFNKIKYKLMICNILFLTLPLLEIKKYLNIFLMKINIHKEYLTGYYSYKTTNIVYFYSILFLIILIIFRKNLIKIYNKKYIYLEKVYIYSCLIGAILYDYGDIAGRLASFFNVEFVLEDKLLKILKNKILAKLLLALFLILLYIVNFKLKNNLEAKYLPYFK